MKESTKTFVFVAVAILLTGAAFFRIPDRSVTDTAFKDQGLPFFPDFKDPFACTDLQVVDYDESTAKISEFQVKFKDGQWVIPSHYDYPADAKDRLAKTASGVMDLLKDTVRSDNVEDQEKMGVGDPLDAKASSLKGRGKRITLRDASEKILADFIIGKEIRDDKTGQRYVRVPGQKRVYGVNLKVDLSTKFADWIETNLLKVEAAKIRKVTFDGHKVNPEQRTITPGELLSIERKDSAGPWTLEGLPEDKELNPEKLTAMTSALADLKIAGVRPKPAGLAQDLKGVDGADIKLKSEDDVLSLIRRGFYPTKKGLMSNQGDVVVITEEGVSYTLRYGEIVVASGLDLTAGEEAEEAGKKAADPEKQKKTAAGAPESRYLFVTASFDPSIIPPPKGPESSDPPKFPADPFQKAPDDPKRIAEEKEIKDKADKAKADYDKKIADGEKRVKELNDRFAAWYYVTPGESFKSISLDRKGLVQAKGEKPPGGNPGMPAGLPPGFPQSGLPGFPGQ